MKSLAQGRLQGEGLGVNLYQRVNPAHSLSVRCVASCPFLPTRHISSLFFYSFSKTREFTCEWSFYLSKPIKNYFPPTNWTPSSLKFNYFDYFLSGRSRLIRTKRTSPRTGDFVFICNSSPVFVVKLRETHKMKREQTVPQIVLQWIVTL